MSASSYECLGTEQVLWVQSCRPKADCISQLSNQLNQIAPNILQGGLHLSHRVVDEHGDYQVSSASYTITSFLFANAGTFYSQDACCNTPAAARIIMLDATISNGHEIDKQTH
jgi:hypothetical protein